MMAVGSVVAALLLGCASGAPKPAVVAPVASDAEKPLRIVEAPFGAAHSVRQEPLVVPFGVNQNGIDQT